MVAKILLKGCHNKLALIAIDLHDLGNKYEVFPSNHIFLQFMLKQNCCNLGATLL